MKQMKIKMLLNYSKITPGEFRLVTATGWIVSG
jgi:hypothetical protein